MTGRSHAFALSLVALVAASCTALLGDGQYYIAQDAGSDSMGSSSGTGSGSSSGSSSSGTDSGSSSGTDAGAGDGGSCDLCLAAGGQCSNSVCTVTENPGNLSATTKSQLQAGGTGDSAFAWLYPYDKTVFPRGLLPPTLQFAGTAPDAVWVHIAFAQTTYDGYFGPSTAPKGGGQVALSASAWSTVTALATGTDSVEVSLTKISGGQVAGPITRSWTIAQGSARGTIYYETVGSQLAGGTDSVGIMEIQPGATVPTVLKSGCGNVCHTASADGSTLVAAASLLSSASYDLHDNASSIDSASDLRFVYGGLYPDGTFAMSATNFRTWTNLPSRLYDTKTGANIPASGWDGVITNGGTAVFSPDGTVLAFVHEDKDSGHTIATMDFQLSSHTFTNLVDLAADPTNFLAWPAFTPDSRWVVFHEEPSSTAPFETDGSNHGDLYFVDVASKTVARLDALDGYTGSGTTQTYLPASDPDLSFAPTVLPEAVGGYFWVVFTSHRSYGNTIASMAPGADGTADELGQLWVAAMDLSPTAGKDPSHPAFHLDGQEQTADNLRGFWVLDPCQGVGIACTGGDQCCSGFCRQVSGTNQCVSPPAQGCSNTLEACTFASDCCVSTNQCINGHCAQAP
jgi:hypothetical protein